MSTLPSLIKVPVRLLILERLVLRDALILEVLLLIFDDFQNLIVVTMTSLLSKGTFITRGTIIIFVIGGTAVLLYQRRAKYELCGYRPVYLDSEFPPVDVVVLVSVLLDGHVGEVDVLPGLGVHLTH